MFTGIIETQAEVLSIGAGGLSVRPVKRLAGVRRGESIAVDGVCLSVDKISAGRLSFRLLKETLRSSSLGGLRKGSRVNLERSLRFGARLGGHLLLGHVDGRGEIVALRAAGKNRTLEIGIPSRLRRLLVPKGPIGIDGVSLTLDRALGARSVRVHLIPLTLAETSLGGKRVGDAVNIEIDVIAKYVWGMLE